MPIFVLWLYSILKWYFGLTLLGWIFLPITSFLFARFKDHGYPFSKVIGLITASFLFFVLNNLRLLAFTSFNIYLVCLLIFGLNWLFWQKTKVKLPSWKTILAYEGLFLGLFLTWTYIKGFESTIRSLEKFMDFGFIQSILNQRYLPPQDIWFASTRQQPLFINYYYYGHYFTAFIIQATKTMPSVGYNLMLTTIFAFGCTLSFTLGYNLYHFLAPHSENLDKRALLSGILALLITNLGGNLHTIYLFTKGYVPENPVPFWQILSTYNPAGFWYPNATRFIPFTIHEFPSYSYVVSDLHGHVLDIPVVLLLLGLTLGMVTSKKARELIALLPLYALSLGVTYMTNSTDFLVYSTLLFFVLVIFFDALFQVLLYTAATVGAALVFTLPFSLHFKPFASSLGMNCAPDFLVKLKSIGPLLFEANKCQTSPLWMLFVLWGFFWLNFLVFLRVIFFAKEGFRKKNKIHYYFFFLFVISILLTLFAEFFYFKDIYPAHFRANTMFKLGYQAFIMMSLLSAPTIVYIIKTRVGFFFSRLIYGLILIPMLILVLIYYQYAVPSYFGRGGFKTLNGSLWIKDTYPDSYAIIQKLNQLKAKNQNIKIVEAHGDSYTDYDLVSAHTGIPTIVGWPVHEWLWRGSYDVVGPRAEEVRLIYEGTKRDLPKIKKILKKYAVTYIVVAEMEKQKYPLLNWQKFYKIGTPVYSNKLTKSYLFKVYE